MGQARRHRQRGGSVEQHIFGESAASVADADDQSMGRGCDLSVRRSILLTAVADVPIEAQ
jgi:hypothetical protein